MRVSTALLSLLVAVAAYHGTATSAIAAEEGGNQALLNGRVYSRVNEGWELVEGRLRFRVAAGMDVGRLKDGARQTGELSCRGAGEPHLVGHARSRFLRITS